jgi:hypothetical protein
VLLQDASRAGAVKWAAEAAPLHDTEHIKHYAAVLRAALVDVGLPAPAASSAVLSPVKRGAKGGLSQADSDHMVRTVQHSSFRAVTL